MLDYARQSGLPVSSASVVRVDAKLWFGASVEACLLCVALGIALALAGAAGSLLMPFYPAYPLVGQVFVLMAFVPVGLGTLGNVIGALVAQLMVGVAESLGIHVGGAGSGLVLVFARPLLPL